MNFKGIRVLLLDGYCRQNAILLKELNKLGCIVTTLNGSKLDVGYASRYPKKRILDDRFQEDLAYYEQWILDAARSGEYDVIFPVLEESTEIIARRIDDLTPYVKVVAPPLDACKKAHDKQLTMKICMENGIGCPITKMDDETMDEYLQKVSFPLALKPRQGRGSVGFKKVHNREELDALIESGDVVVEEYVIQEFVEEAEVHRVSYTVIDDNGNAVSSMISKSTRPYPLGIGTNSLFESVDMPDVAKQSELLLQMMGWRGYASVCFIENEHDKIPKVMEINGRISASFKVSVLAGLPIVRQLLELAYGVIVTPAPEQLNYGMRVSHSQAGFMWWAKSKDRFRKEPSTTGRKGIKDIVFSLSDPLPYVTYSIQCVMKNKKGMEKRKR